MRCVARIEAGVLKCDEAYRNFLKLDHDLDVAKAKATLRARENGSPEFVCKAETEVATVIERADRDVAEALNKLCDRQMRALHAELDTLRSIGTSVRQAYAGTS